MQIRMLREIDAIFEGVPQSRKALEAKEEMLQNLMEKYNDLCAEGKSEEAAFQIAIASIGDISDLLEALGGPVRKQDGYAETVVSTYEDEPVDDSRFVFPGEREGEEKHNRALIVTTAVMMYIMSPLALILFPGRFGIAVLFVLIAAATGLLIYKGMTSPGKSTIFSDEEALREEKGGKKVKMPKAQRRFLASLSSALWMVAVAVYFLISFSTGAWGMTWIIFLIAAAANNLLRAFVDLYRR